MTQSVTRHVRERGQKRPSLAPFIALALSAALASCTPTERSAPPSLTDADPAGQADRGESLTADQRTADQHTADQWPSGGDARPDGELPPPGDRGLTDQGGEQDRAVESCDVSAAIQSSGCASAGCHAPPVQGELELTADSEGLAETLVNAESTTLGCEGRLLVDPERPARSLLLQVIGAEPPPGGEDDSCQLLMPPGGGEIAAEHRTCIEEWVAAVAAAHQGENPPQPFEASPVEAALRKVKSLVNGQAPTAEELAELQADPSQLRALVEIWAEGPAYERKLTDFFEVALQQRVQVEDLEQFDRLRRNRNLNAPYQRVLEESFVRTALDIVSRGAPFSEILTTRRWIVTTANLVLLRYADQSADERTQQHILSPSAETAPGGLARQIRDRTWHIPSLPGDCTIPQFDALEMLFGFVLRNRCRPRPERNLRFADHPLQLEDFEDWRAVEFVDSNDAEDGEERIPFYDLVSLRRADRVVTRVPRVGFFTTNAFFNNWPTNIDNQFRVTVNQALLGALHIGFASSEATVPLRSDGLDEEHSEPESACYGCHRQLDPMRLYFERSFNVSYQRPTSVPGDDRLFDNSLTPSFAFRGETDEGGRVYAFAEILAAHPRFPIAWAQKLCLYANSARCDENDPFFIELVDRFRADLDFRALALDLFSSPLVTGLAESETWRGEGPLISITRRDHLCSLLDERTGRSGVCQINRVRQVLGLIPNDDFARGAVDPSQPTLPSAFHFAAAEAVCEEVSRAVINRNNNRFPLNDPPAAVTALVSDVMALPVGHPRHDEAVAALGAHFETLRAQDIGALNSLRSTFTLACLSPDMMGLGL